MDDKKKIAILAGLFVVMIAVGAFQFTKGSGEVASEEIISSKPKVSKETKVEIEADVDVEATDSSDDVDPGLIAAARLNPRDPFDGTPWDNNLKAATPQPTAPAEKPKPIAPPIRNIAGSGFAPLPIGDGVLPNVGATAEIPGGKLPSIEDFPYTVAGTMVGERSFVLLKDASGKQKLVSAGSSIDGDSQVISVSRGSVTVKHRGKTKTFRVGGNPSNDRNEDKQ